MDSTEIDMGIQQLEAQSLLETNTIDDADWIQCQLDNLRFRIRLENLKRRAYEMQNKPTDFELLNKYLQIKF